MLTCESFAVDDNTGSGKAEVAEFGYAFLTVENIFGFDVAMNHSVLNYVPLMINLIKMIGLDW